MIVMTPSRVASAASAATSWASNDPARRALQVEEPRARQGRAHGIEVAAVDIVDRRPPALQ